MKGMLLAVAVAATVSGCSGSDAIRERASQSASFPSGTPSSVSAPSVAAPSKSPIACHPAPAALVQLINAAFTDGETLTNPTSVDGPQDATYIAGDISQDGGIVSHADVWLSQHGALFSLSSDARKRTMLADGRDFASAGDEYGSAAQDCIRR